MLRFVAVLLVLCAAVPAQAKTLRPLSLRELTYRADTVVLAIPIDGAASGHFKVTTVLRGGLKVDETIALAASDRNFYSLGAFVPPDPDDPPPLPTDVLLFLAAPVEQGKPVQLVSSGLFLGMADGAVLAPRQLSNPGGWTMTPQEGRVWSFVVKDAKAAAATVEEVLHLKATGGKERAAGLLRWVEQHRLEFGGGFFDNDRIGWGSLETDVFDWVCEKGRPDECWTAARLYAELNHGAALPLKGPYFSTPAGRDLLLRVALNDTALDGERARALTLLTHPRTLAPVADAAHPEVAPCSDADLVALVRKLMPLLETKSDTMRTAALTALRSVRLLNATAAPMMSEWQEVLPVLDKAYKTEKPGGVYRDLLVEMIHTIGGAEHWKDVSGNKTGMAALLRDASRSTEEVHFWLQVLPATDKIYERPTLVLERLDAKDKVLETKTLPLPVANAPRWEEGWTPGDLLLVQFSSAAMASAPPPPRRGIYSGPSRKPAPDNGQNGVWRVTVRGTVGKEKMAWSSEPKLFPIAPLSKVKESVIIDDFDRIEK